MSDNPLTQEQIDNLRASQEKLKKLDIALEKMKMAKIAIPPETLKAHDDLKASIAALLMVYGKR